MLNSILNYSAATLTPVQFLICCTVSVILGISLAAVHTYRNHCSRNFFITLALLPLIVQTVIMLVNGNLGTGVAVMGAFSLVRFRSVPGNSREINSIFLAMAVGLAVGMGYLWLASLLFLLIGFFTLLLLSLPEGKSARTEKELKITIPENLDYFGVFDEIFGSYTSQNELIRVKTVNMGSLYELQYKIKLKSQDLEKRFIDELRCRNGNLPIVCAKAASDKEEL